MSTSTLAGGSVRIMWDADPCEVTITGPITYWLVNGAPITFPYTMASSTTFTTPHAGNYEVSVQHHGYEVADTPDSTRTVALRFGEQLTFEPSVDGTPNSKFMDDIRSGLGADIVADMQDPLTDVGASISATIGAVTDPIEADVAAIPATYASARQGKPGTAYAVAIGDSITYGQGNGSPMRQRDDWFPQLCARTRQRIRYGGVYATGGYTLAQIRDIHLPSALALDPKPSACFVFGGTNDVNLGDYPTGSYAVLDDICTQLVTAGIRPVLVSLLPRNDAGDADQQQWNVWLRAFAARSGFDVLDMGSGLLTAAGTRDSSLYTDNVHPNVAGQTAMAKAAETSPIVNNFTRQQFTSRVSGDASNLIPSGYGLFGVDTDANGLGDGWTGVGSLITFTRPTPTADDDLVGSWQRVSRATGGATGTAFQRDISTGFAVGDRLAFSGRFRATVEGTGTLYTIQAAWLGVTAQNLEAIFNWTKDVPDGGFYVEGVVPSGATGIRVAVIATVPTSGTSVLDVGELTLTNLTAAGAA